MKKIFSLIFITLINVTTASSQNTNYEIYAIKYADIGVTLPLSVLVLDAPKTEKIDAIFMYWLLKGNNGKNILVDAGFLKDIEHAKDYSVTNYIRPDLMLPELGLKAEDITDIIITHPHWDHIDGVDLFPNANVWVQKRDYNYFVGDAWQKNGRGGFSERDVLKLVKLNLTGKLFIIDGDDIEIIPNIKVYIGSRHTFESQYVLVQNENNKIILASDNVYTYYNLNNLMSAPVTFDTNGYVKAMERMKALVTDIKYIIPGHDKLLFSKFPKITNDIIKID